MVRCIFCRYPIPDVRSTCPECGERNTQELHDLAPNRAVTALLVLAACALWFLPLLVALLRRLL